MAKPTTKGKGKGKQEYDDTNRGVLFINDKDGNEARPDYRGNITINPDDFEPDADGLVRLRLSAWNKTSKNETVGDYLSIAVSPMQQN